MEYDKLVKQKEDEQSELISRMDEDKDLLYLKRYILCLFKKHQGIGDLCRRISGYIDSDKCVLCL